MATMVELSKELAPLICHGTLMTLSHVATGHIGADTVGVYLPDNGNTGVTINRSWRRTSCVLVDNNGLFSQVKPNNETNTYTGGKYAYEGDSRDIHCASFLKIISQRTK